jgi:glycosyltransferase involved in cell wall biosynthesis
LKVLFVITQDHDPGGGGVQRVTDNLGRFLAAHGYDIAVFSTSAGPHQPLPHGTLFTAPLEGGHRRPENVKALLDAIDSFRPDVVINQMPYEGGLREALQQARSKRSFALLACIHNSLFSVVNNPADYARKGLPGPFKPLAGIKPVQWLFLLLHKRKHAAELRSMLAIHDRVITETPANIEEMKYFLSDLPADRVSYIANPVADIEEVTREHRQPLLLHVGGIRIPQKRSDLLLPVWKRVCHELPDWHFRINGDGDYWQTLKEQIATQNIPRVDLPPKCDPFPDYRRASIFIMTSAFEGLPNVLIEAQSRGVVPIVYDSYPALRWIVNDGVDAVLVPPFDDAAMAKAIVELARDDERRARMSKAALKNAERFTMDRIGAEWLTRLPAWSVLPPP